MRNCETQEVIFPFPAGPISIAEGETKSITMKGFRFSLSMPSIEPVTLNPKVLKVVGELNNGLGSNAFLIHFEDPLPFAPSPSEPPANPRRYELEYATAELPKKLDAQTRRHTLVVRHEVEEFAKPEFLVTPQMPGLGKHSFDHALRLVPMSA